MSVSSAAASAARVAGRDQQPLAPVGDELRHAGEARGEERQRLRGGFHDHVGQAVAVAVVALLAGQHEAVRLAHRGDHRVLRLPAAPRDAVREAEALAPAALQRVAQFAGADVDEPPVQVGGKAGQRLRAGRR